MTKIKMCGIRREIDVQYANEVRPDFIGYVFFKKSKRYVTFEQAEKLTKMLDENIIPVGVFVNEPIENVIALVKSGIIKIAQLHGNENEEYIAQLHNENIEVIKAFIVKSAEDIEAAEKSSADWILLDAGMGDGKTFNHDLLKNITRKYFLAGGLNCDNIADSIKISPYAVDLSSGIETDGFKDIEKMKKIKSFVK